MRYTANILLAAATAFLPWAAMAQVAPGIGEAVRQVAPSAPASAPPSLPGIGAPLAAPLTVLPGGGPTVQVLAIAIEGHQAFDDATLQGLVADAVGGAWTLSQIEALATRLTQHYRLNGYMVARAYVPAQDITDGLLRLRVVEGRLGRVLLDNQSRVRDEVVQTQVDRLTILPALRLDDLEGALLRVNDLSGSRVARADLLPGQAVGTTDLALLTEATPVLSGQLTLDNSGSVYTGRHRLGVLAEWASLAGQGDRLSVGGLGTPAGGLVHGRLAWSVPVSGEGTRVEGALARTRYSLGDRYAALGASGTADGVELNVTYPWQRSRAARVDLGLGLSRRRLTDETDSVGLTLGKRSEALAFRARGQWHQALLGDGGLTQAAATLTMGRIAFDDLVAAAQDALGARTAGNWSKLELSASHSASLASTWLMVLRARLQRTLTGNNLDGSERLGISGAGGVQVYAQGEAAGDHAALAQVDLLHELGTWAGASVRGGGYAAVGSAWVVQPVGDAPTRRQLADAGLVLDLSASRWQLRSVLAHRVSGGEPRSEPTSPTRVLLQASFSF